jgi:cytochrome c-type biogenesis protein CcmH
MTRHIAALILAVTAFLTVTSPAMAVLPDEILADPVLELRARDISRDLRCLVCQNQSIDDSDASLARDLRIIVRERLIDGDTDGEVIAFVVDRYGDFVLLDPPFKNTTLVLWLGPAFIAGIGLLVLILFFRRIRRTSRQPGGGAPSPLSAAERKRLDALLKEEAS